MLYVNITYCKPQVCLILKTMRNDSKQLCNNSATSETLHQSTICTLSIFPSEFMKRFNEYRTKPKGGTWLHIRPLIEPVIIPCAGLYNSFMLVYDDISLDFNLYLTISKYIIGEIFHL